MPLLNTLHYEVSAINAIVISLFSGYTTLYFSRKKHHSKFVFPEQKIYFSFQFMFVILPFIISLISTIVCQHCPVSEGIYFYLIIAAPAAMVGSTIALFVSYITKRYSYLLFTLLWLLLFLSFLPELYYNPQIYFYNPIFTYYPGVIYDQNIEITNKLLSYRIVNIVFSIVVIFLIKVTVKLNKNAKLIVIMGVIFGYLMLGTFKSSFGFATTIDRIRQETKGFIETEHFKIIFPQEITENEKKVLIYNHEFYYKEIKELLNIEPKGKITSFLFKTGAQKKILFGSGNADVAKLWINQIYLNYDSYDNSLKHEISHVFSAGIASGLFKMPANYNPALLEGFAMAIENNYDDFDIDYLTYLAYKNNYKISLKNLFANFSFFAKTSSLSYIYAGAFIKYLANKYGWEKVKLLYSSLQFEKIYKKDITVLEKEFFDYIKNENYPNNKNASNLYFGRLPLIKRICPRATAKETRIAFQYYKNKNYETALKKFESVYEYSKTYSSLVGIIKTEVALKQFGEARKILESNITKYENTSYYYNLENILGNVYSNLGETRLAEKIFKSLVNQNPRFNYKNISLIKLFLLKNDVHKLNHFINNEKNRMKILQDLLLTKPTDAVLQTIVLQKIKETKSENELKNNLIAVTNKFKYSSDTYFQLSKFMFRILDFKNAKYYAELSMQNINPERKDIVEELLKKINLSGKNKLN